MEFDASVLRRELPIDSFLALVPIFSPFKNSTRGFDEWQENRSWTLAPATAQIAKFMKSLQEYPPRIKSLDFDLDAMVADASASQAR